MFFYSISYGEYEQYVEYLFYHEKEFTEDEFKSMVLETESNERLCEVYGFKKIEVHAHFHDDYGF